MSATPTAASRVLLRQRPLRHHRLRTGVRWESSTTEKASQAAANAADKTKSAASNLQSKASSGLSRVTSSAGPAISGVGRAVSRNLGRIGGRTGRLINRIEGLIPPTVYYSKVGLELSKLVFQGQKMSPPSVQTFQSYYQPVINVLRNPQSLVRSASASSTASMTPEQAINQARNVNMAQLAAGGILLAEVLGFFSVGEMLGRMKVVGYRGEAHHEH